MFRSSLWLKYADEAPGAEEATGATLAVSLVPGAGQTAAWVRAVARGEGEAEGAEMRFSSNEGDTRQRAPSPSAIPSWPLRSVTLNPQLNLGVGYPPGHHFIKEETRAQRG